MGLRGLAPGLLCAGAVKTCVTCMGSGLVESCRPDHALASLCTAPDEGLCSGAVPWAEQSVLVQCLIRGNPQPTPWLQRQPLEARTWKYRC